MKKKLVSLVTIATIVLSSSVMVFAEDAKTTAPVTPAVVTPAVVAPVVATPEVVAPVVATPEVVAPVVAEEKFADLDMTTRTFISQSMRDLGSVPQISGRDYDELNGKMWDKVGKDYNYYNNEHQASSTDGAYKVTSAVENKGQYAKIDVIVSYNHMTASLLPIVETTSYYVDKKAVKEITADEYIAATTVKEVAVVAPAAVAPLANADGTATTDVPMFGIRANMETLNYTLSWNDETKTVTVVVDGKDFVTFVAGEDRYVLVADGTVVTLGAAPVNQDGSMFVPVSFFEKVLGATVTSDDNGNYSFKIKA